MAILKKVLLDLGLALVLFLVAAVIAGIVKMQNPECYTCGANVGVTFWWAAFLALQPVLWAGGLTKRARVGIWSAAVGLGALAYLSLEALAASLFVSGNAGTGLSLGLAANSAFDLVALGLSIGGVVYLRKRTAKHNPSPEHEASPSAREPDDRTPEIPGPIEDAIAGLIRQRTMQAAIGERPETMLIPHKRIKLEVMIKAYQHDLARALENLRAQGLPSDEEAPEAERMRAEVAALEYNLRRERRESIEALFEDMKAGRNDLSKFEAEVRAESPLFSVVSKDELGLG